MKIKLWFHGGKTYNRLITNKNIFIVLLISVNDVQ